MRQIFFVAIFLLGLSAVITSDDKKDDSKNPIVELDSGKLKGLLLTSSEQKRKFNAFMSVPYAEPPTDNLRFKPPKPKEPWDGVFVADRENVYCTQFGYSRKNDTEDCLVLNVYSPNLNSDAKLPVMVIFHEGGFLFGSGSFSFYRPEKLMDHDVVFVSPNFRLGVLGFLNTMDEHSPGNYGMLDQVMVLEWIKDNIQKFGGDPNKVTIFGNSAGGASAVFHMLSPLSKGLFHAAIAESGSALSPWAYQSHPLNYARKVGRLANCTDVDSTENLVNCLKTKSTDELFQARKAEVKYYQLYNVGPSVESDHGYGFLKDDPIKLLEKGQINKVPFVTGVVKDEGRFLTGDVIHFKNFTGQKFLDEEFCGFMAYVLDLEVDDVMREVCSNTIKEYFDGQNIDDPEVLNSCLTKSFGDMMMCAGTSKTAELNSAAGIPTQAYKFTYLTEGNNSTGNFTDHGDEITLMLDRKWGDDEVINNTKNDRTMGKMMNFIWTQFATKVHNTIDIKPPEMDPIKWPLFSSESESSKKYLEINLHPQIMPGLLCEKTDFWTKQLISLKKI